MRNKALLCFLKDLVWRTSCTVVKILLLCIFANKNESSQELCQFWLTKWTSGDWAHYANDKFLRLQLNRPHYELWEFILSTKLTSTRKDNWKRMQYFTYLAKLIESHSFQGVLAKKIPAPAIIICTGELVVSKITSCVRKLIPSRKETEV